VLKKTLKVFLSTPKSENITGIPLF
jgi:hypothetical protein